LYQSLKMTENKDPPRENPSPKRKAFLRGTVQRHRNGPAWASNDALSKALARARVPQHLAPRTLLESVFGPCG